MLDLQVELDFLDGTDLRIPVTSVENQVIGLVIAQADMGRSAQSAELVGLCILDSLHQSC